MTTSTRARVITRIAVGTMAAAAVALSPVISTGVAIADGTTSSDQTVPPPPPQDDPDGHNWLD